MRLPWQSDAEQMRKKAEAMDRAELQARADALAEVRLSETRKRILARWADAERAITARRTVAALSFAIHLVPPVPVRQIRPLAWGNRRAGA